MSEKSLDKMRNEDEIDIEIVLRDPIVVDWKLKLIEKFFKKSTQMKSDDGDSSKVKKEINCNVEHEQKMLTDGENSEIVEKSEFNTFNYWKINVFSDVLTEVKDKEGAKDIPKTLVKDEIIDDYEIKGEMPEYYDNNWWKSNNDIRDIKMEIKSDDIEQDQETNLGPRSPLFRNENVKSVDSFEGDVTQEIEMCNEFNWWKQDLSNVEIEPDKIFKDKKYPDVIKTTANQKTKFLSRFTKDTRQHCPPISGEKKDKTAIKSNPRPNVPKISNRDQNGEKRKLIPKRNSDSEASDQNNNFTSKEKAPGSVIVVNNLDTKFMDCDRLFNLLSPYAQVQSIKFLKVSDFRKAMVELSSKEGAQRVMKYIKEENVFGKIIRIEPSSKLRVTEFNPSQLPPLPNGTKAFKDYSEEIRRNSMDYLRASMYPPARTIYFCKTPKMSDEDFKDIFEKRKAPVPYKIMWFPSGGMGCLQFKTKEEALKAICIANLVQAKNGRRIHLAFTFERKDSDFYIKK